MKQSIDLRLNYPVLPGQDAELKAQVKSALENVEVIAALSPAGGTFEDRQTGADWLSRAGYAIDPADVHIGAGGHHSCVVALLAAGLQNKTVVVEALTYSNFRSIAAMLNVKLIPCSADNLGIVPSSLEEVCKTGKADALYIMPAVNNPTGTVLPADRRKEIVTIARENNLLIIEDDAYGFLDDSALLNFLHLAPERTFYIYSFSKPLAPFAKVSYLVAPPLFAERVTEALRLTSAHLSAVLSSVVNTMIRSGRLKEIINEKRKIGFERQQKAQLLLKDYNVYGHKNGWHLWVNLPEHIRSSELNERLAKDGVSIVPSTAFSASEKVYEQGIRIALGGEADFSRVIEGIERVKHQIDIF
jgi:DNA-binding transcriptional MocR family regulator